MSRLFAFAKQKKQEKWSRERKSNLFFIVKRFSPHAMKKTAFENLHYLQSLLSNWQNKIAQMVSCIQYGVESPGTTHLQLKHVVTDLKRSTNLIYYRRSSAIAYIRNWKKWHEGTKISYSFQVDFCYFWVSFFTIFFSSKRQSTKSTIHTNQRYSRLTTFLEKKKRDIEKQSSSIIYVGL